MIIPKAGEQQMPEVKAMAGRAKLWIVVSIVALIALFCVFMYVFSSCLLNARHGDHPETMQPVAGNAGKALVVYQPSVSSVTGDAAHAIARGLYDAGYEVTLNYPGSHLPTDLSEYSVVVFGGPVYGGSVPKALTEYIQSVDLNGKRVVLFSTSGGGKDLPHDRQKELVQMEGCLNGVAPFSSTKLVASDKGLKDEAYDLGKAAAGK
jgi:flavodoxin